MATIWRGAEPAASRSARHSVVRLRSQTGQDCSVMRPRASPRIANSCNIRVSKLSQAPLGNMTKKCFLPGIVACLQGPGGMEPEGPGDDLPEIVESSPEKQVLDETLKKAANGASNGAANSEASSEEDLMASEADSGLQHQPSMETGDDSNWNQLPVPEVLRNALKSLGIGYLLKSSLVSKIEVILTIIVSVVWLNFFYRIGFEEKDLFHVFCPTDSRHPYCVVFLEFVNKYFRRK